MTKINQLDTVKLNDYSGKFIDVKRFKTDVYKELGQKLYEIPTLEILYYEILKLIDKTHNVQNNSVSIKENIQILLAHFGFDKYKKASIQNLTTEEVCTSDENINLTNDLFGFNSTPYEHLISIKKEVEFDLKYFNELIKHYEELPPIKELGDYQIRFSGRKAAIIPFYKRCLEERNIILDYYLDGMYERALTLATKPKGKLGIAWDVSHIFYQPYKFRSNMRILKIIRNYDYRKIDTVSHRIELLSINIEEEKLTDLYNSDKNLFYATYFNDSDIKILFEDIHRIIDKLPFSEQRKDIINQLEKFFMAKEWLAFYAICLPQVEGLFSELLKIENKKTKGKPSLSTNVRAVRSWVHEYREKTLDYFEYIVPEYRNKFSHGSLEVIDNLEINSHDLLTDLYSVLIIFSETEVPSVKLKSMIKEFSLYYYNQDLFGFTDYFKCYNEIKQSLKKDLSDSINLFDQKFIIPNMDMIQQKISTVVESYHQSKEQFNLNLKDSGYPELGMLSKKQGIKMTMIKDTNKLFKENLSLFADYLELNEFFYYYNKYKKRFKEKYLEKECSFWQNEREVITDIKMIEDVIKETKDNSKE